MPDEPLPVDVPDLQAEPVGTRPRSARIVVDNERLAHLREGVGGQHITGVAGEERRPIAQVGDRRPQLPRGCHRAGVVLRLRHDQICVRVHRETWCGRSDRPRRRARHAERLEQLAPYDFVPRGATQTADHLTQRGEADV